MVAAIFRKHTYETINSARKTKEILGEGTVAQWVKVLF